MNIVWICNKTPAAISRIAGEKVNNMGGWLDDMCERFINMESINLTVLSRDTVEREINKSKLSFYSFIENNCTTRFRVILRKTNPDIVHIWGTEFSHSNEVLKVCQELGISERCVVSIQGLVSLYGKRHYIEGIPEKVVKHYTLRDFIRRDNIQKGREKFIQRGKTEIEALKRTRHIIGRTDWDCAASQMFNSDARYHFCNESLRESFYHNSWDIKKIEPHSIFVSQCSYPIKGFHYILEAMPEILRKFPDTHLYTTGKNLLHLSRKDKILITTYQWYLINLIKQYGLSEHITFLGELSEQEMCAQYLKANVFVSASTIENSPNSVGEAMLVGCPVVSSDVGGVKNMLEHGKEGFVYQSSAPYMLAYYVERIFENDNLAKKLSMNAQKHASVTHNRKKNMETLYSIYCEIMNTSRKIGGGGQ